jgi:uncharacterized NAD(P)/FAD-binding protein YdhS
MDLQPSSVLPTVSRPQPVRARLTRAALGVRERPVDPADQLTVGGAGCGLAGMAFAGHLTEIVAQALDSQTGGRRSRRRDPTPPPMLRVDMWEPKAAGPGGWEQVGRGRPYGPDTLAARLNIPFHRMGWSHLDRGRFPEYLGETFSLGRRYRRYWEYRRERGLSGEVAPEAEIRRFFPSMPTRTADAPEYLPRSVFGDHLNKEFWGFAERGRELGIDLRVVPHAAAEMQSRAAGAQVALGAESAGASALYDLGGLFVGGGKPRDLYPGLTPADDGSYVDDLEPLGANLAAAWRLARSQAKLGDDPWIAMLGARLSCWDAVSTLREMEIRLLMSGAESNAMAADGMKDVGPGDIGPSVNIAVMAPRAQLPAVAMPGSGDVDLAYFTLERLAEHVRLKGQITMTDVRRWAEAEFARHGLRAEDLDRAFCFRGSPMDNLRRQMAACEGHDEPLRLGILLLTKMLIHNQLLLRFGDASVREFFTEYESNITALRGPMPVHVAETMLKSLQGGGLEILPGLGYATRLEGGRYAAGFDDLPARTFPCMVNATGLRDSLELDIVKSVLAQGIGMRDGRGGLLVDFVTQQLIAPEGFAGPLGPPVVAVGDLTNGTHQNQSSALRISQAAFRAAVWTAQRLLPAALPPEAVARAERYVRSVMQKAGLIPADYEHALPWATLAADWIKAIETVHAIPRSRWSAR